MSTITTEKFSTILDDNLDETLATLNSTIAYLRKSLDEEIKHTKFVEAKFGEFLKSMKKADSDRTEQFGLKLSVEALQKQNIQSERQFCLHLSANSKFIETP